MQIQATQVLMSMPINMNGNDITNTANIHSNLTNPIYFNNNGVAKVKIDASGITMQNSGNIDMNSTKIINLVSGINPNDAVNRNDIATSLIPITAWRSGETIQKVLKGYWLNDLKNNPAVYAGQIGGLSAALATSIFINLHLPLNLQQVLYIVRLTLIILQLVIIITIVIKFILELIIM